MKSKLGILVVSAFGLVLLSSCSNNVKQTLGLAADAPDEFKVISNPPLSVPPEFSLRPPVPGAKGPNQESADAKAMDVLNPKAGGSVRGAEGGATSKGESAIINRLGASAANSNIRTDLDDEDRALAEEKRHQGKVSKFFAYLRGEDNSGSDPVVDASSEKKRISENKDQGKPVNEGEVATKDGNDGKKKGLLNRIFNF